ncbi:tape measure protein [Acinetobacter sp.]|uniref:tape measure protein n=1 Tax=Acinetobacter sp. TaxID=472 RepID=UPI0025BEAA45|nr:tape measure protein [Acinetobacter sp.]
MAESVLRIVIDSRNAERNARNIANELQNIERNGNHASRSMDSMSVATRSLVGYMGGLVTIGAAISKMDAYTGLQNRLKLVTDSQLELNTAMNDTFGIAQKTAATWDSVAMVYQRFADNADRLGISMKQTAALTETVSKAISVSGGSAASAEAALMQFGQALASGVLRGEEFNSIAEQAPGLLKAIAMGMDTDIGSLRAMAAEGKITGDELVKALSKAKPYIDDLFNKTDFTIAQSFTQLSNEVTKFVGEAGKGSGAASALGDSIGFLAKNLSTIADIAIVGGVAMLTKTILAQTVAIQGSITASVARRAADAAVLQSQVQLAALEVQRTRQIAAQAISEIGLARQELNSATTRTARAAATMRLTQAEIAHRIALNQTTAAIATNTAAQNALNASRAIGSRMLALVGGPIGAITLGVAGLAAGYMYLKNRTAEANAKLEEQGKVAQKTDEELKKLAGNDKKSAVEDLTAAFNAQNAELAKSKESVDAVLFAIRAASAENEKARKVTEDARRGVISYDEAIKQLNAMDIPTDLYEMLKKQAKEYDNNADKAGNSQRVLKIFGIEVKLAGNAAQNAVDGLDSNSNAMRNNADATNAAANAQSKYISNLQKGAAQTVMTNKLIAKGWEIERAKMASQAAFENGGKVSAKDIQIIDMNIAANKKLQASEDAITNAKKGSAKATSVALSQHRKDAKEANRIDEEQRNLREQYIYAYADREKQIELSLAKEIAEIHKANFANPEPYLEAANKRAYYEKQIYLSQLQFEINEFQMSEEQKLKYSYDIKNLQLHQNSEITKESKEIAINALEEQYNQELALIKLSQETRLFQMREALMSETAAMQERYRLEREQILLNSKLSQEQKLREIALSKALQEEENRKRLNSAVQQWGSINAELTGTTDQFNLEKERFDRLDKSQALFDAELVMAGENYALKEQAYQAHVDRMTAIEDSYQVSAMQLQLSYGESITGSMADMFKSMGGEQSKGYQVMYSISRGFAAAQAAISLVTNIAKASEIGFPQNIPMIAGAMAQGASIVAMLSSTQEPAGFKSGGYTGNIGLNQEAGVVHGQEYVLNAEATKRVGINTLNAINNGGTIQAEKQAQANAKVQGSKPQAIDNNLRVIMVKDENEAKDWLYGPDGEKAFLYHMKRNRSKV